MDLIAKRRLKVDSPIVEIPGKNGGEPTYKRTGVEKWISPGEQFTVSDDIGATLVKRHFAVDADAPPEAKPIVPTQTGPTVTLTEPPAA
ncbi:hypothetical protein FAZ95_13825 [Trinickia violacea]|uniref:Uncharacterized protein n=1 Tax=Trinickia violacea TaxID=2571746 RepID=A0A4P8IMH7_9BURK|nr:hypothetical protein [Trinickia violacea]QCP50162.1 hypothetical protein FAZ95_13825 [Trinickia violacea]